MKKLAENIFNYSIVLLLGIVIGVYGYGNRLGPSESMFRLFKSDDKLSKVMQLVRKNYVDSVNVDSLQNTTINELLQSLDPHSVYLPPVEATANNERLEGSFNGIGMECHLLRDTLYATYIFPSGPSAKAGIKPGDQIIKINDTAFSGTNLNSESVLMRLKGEKGVDVKLELKRSGEAMPRIVTLTRGRVDLSSVDIACMAASQTGYIKVSRFAATTDQDFKKAIVSLKQKGMQKLVLDLRGNGGGYLTAATAMADEFLPVGKLIMFTKGSHEPRTDYFSTDSGIFKTGKLVILIDEFSASASEILAGAMQDLDRATIVGRRSFGKGLVQEQFPFKDGSAVNLTVARYYTPSGRSIQKSYKQGIANYRNELLERSRKGEMLSAENNLADTVLNQQKKYLTANGRLVSSGGGIMPDVFVPADTTGHTPLISKLIAQDVFMDFLLDKLQNDLKRYSDFFEFDRKFNLTDKVYGEFIQYASKKTMTPDKGAVRDSKDRILHILKAFSARFKFGNEAYYQVMNQQDKTLKEALVSIR